MSRGDASYNPVVNDLPPAAWVIEQARALGFDLCGVAPAERFEELARLPEWLARGYAGEMMYLRDARRTSPETVLEGARSVIVCAINYNTPLPYSTEFPASGDSIAQSAGECAGPRGWISRYAWGDDYHEVLLTKLNALIERMRLHFSQPFTARAYVDTGPVAERVAAKYAGLCWLAKNTCLINAELGSWLFLGVIVTTLELAPSLEAAAPPPDLCGNCRLCLDACPTGAIVEPYVLDARRCISYLTIELRGSIPLEFREALGRHVFGCDICQDVCPWNRKAPVTSVPAFLPRRIEANSAAPDSEKESPSSGIALEDEQNPERFRHSERSEESLRKRSLFAPELVWLVSMSEEEFRAIFRGSAIKRAKWRGLVRNACVALGNSGVREGDPAWSRIGALFERLSASKEPLIAEHARWALERLRAG